MEQTITKLFDLNTILNFWFKNSGPASSFELAFWTGVFGLLVFFGLITLIYSKLLLKDFPPKQKLLDSVFWVFISFGFSGALFLALRYLSPNFLGVRAIPAAVWCVGLVWGFYLIFRYLKKSPLEVLKFETRVLKERYFKKNKV